MRRLNYSSKNTLDMLFTTLIQLKMYVGTTHNRLNRLLLTAQATLSNNASSRMGGFDRFHDVGMVESSSLRSLILS